jgi:hypothetical protein
VSREKVRKMGSALEKKRPLVDKDKLLENFAFSTGIIYFPQQTQKFYHPLL